MESGCPRTRSQPYSRIYGGKSILLGISTTIHNAVVRMAYSLRPPIELTSSCSMSSAMDASTAVCTASVSRRGAASGKTSLQRDVNNGPGSTVEYLLVPPVEKFLDVRGFPFQVIDYEPVEGLVVESIVDLTPLGSGLECEVKPCESVKISSVRANAW